MSLIGLPQNLLAAVACMTHLTWKLFVSDGIIHSDAVREALDFYELVLSMKQHHFILLLFSSPSTRAWLIVFAILISSVIDFCMSELKLTSCFLLMYAVFA